MDFKTIFFSMALTLIALFIFAYFYRSKELQRTKLEASYYEYLLKHRSDPSNQENLQKLKDVADKLGELQGRSEKSIEERLQKDIQESNKPNTL